MTNKYRDTIVWGWDTETNEGPPISLQVFSEDSGVEKLWMVTGANILKTYIRFVDKLPSNSTHVMYAHNLKFDLTSLFWPIKEQLVRVNGFDFIYEDWEISGVHGSPSFAKLWNPHKKTSVYLLDSFLWFQTSLEKAADLVCPDLPKLPKPEGLGTKNFKRTDSIFYDYAMRDAEVSYHLGKVVQGFHQEFDISQALTLAHMASKIFLTHFLKNMIMQPPVDWIVAAQKSYHGGKNNLIPGGAPKWHGNVCALDISSAYPYAMTQLPSFSNAKLFKKTKIRASNKRTYTNGGVPRFGVYLVSGETAQCNWPAIFDDKFKPIRGKFNDVWVNSFDLNAALSEDEVKLTSIHGFHYDHAQDRKESPFAAYVKDFYNRKQTATDPIQRYLYKTVLNSLYGKFIQTTAKEDETTGERYFEAGNMYHPFIASAITGHTRNYIHAIEHEFKTIHTATDGVFAYNKRTIPAQVRRFNKKHVGDGELGSLQFEGLGDLLLLRNKLYILYGETGFPSKYFKGKTITKYAMHGFQSSVYELERLVANNIRHYTANRPNQLRESLKSKTGKIPNKFENREMVLKIGKIEVA